MLKQSPRTALWTRTGASEDTRRGIEPIKPVKLQPLIKSANLLVTNNFSGWDRSPG
jgi:hypothetical protein